MSQTNPNVPVLITNITSVSAGLANIVTSAIIRAATGVAINGLKEIWLTINDAWLDIELITFEGKINRRIQKFEIIANRYNEAITRAQSNPNYPPTLVQKLVDSLTIDLSQQMVKVLRNV